MNKENWRQMNWRKPYFPTSLRWKHGIRKFYAAVPFCHNYFIQFLFVFSFKNWKLETIMMRKMLECGNGVCCIRFPWFSRFNNSKIIRFNISVSAVFLFPIFGWALSLFHFNNFFSLVFLFFHFSFLIKTYAWIENEANDIKRLKMMKRNSNCYICYWRAEQFLWLAHLWLRIHLFTWKWNWNKRCVVYCVHRKEHEYKT